MFTERASLISEANLINLQMRCKLGGTARYEFPELWKRLFDNRRVKEFVKDATPS